MYIYKYICIYMSGEKALLPSESDGPRTGLQTEHHPANDVPSLRSSTHIHTYVHACIRTWNLHTCMHACMHMHPYIILYICTHTTHRDSIRRCAKFMAGNLKAPNIAQHKLSSSDPRSILCHMLSQAVNSLNLCDPLRSLNSRCDFSLLSRYRICRA